MSSKATEIAKNLPTLEHPDGSPIRALVVDDEEMLKELVSMGLKMIGWDVQSAGDGPSALAIARDWRPDVLVLDIMMPGFDGLELLSRIRKFYPEVPCLFLTAKDSVDNRIEGLAAGADDYVTKPFSLAVLRARVNRLLRRGSAPAATLELGPFSFDFERLRFMRNGTEVELSKTEQRLLRLLVEHRGQTLTREQLLDRVWDGGEFVDANALSVAVKRLRDKLTDAPIKTVYGLGYTWEEKR